MKTYALEYSRGAKQDIIETAEYLADFTSEAGVLRILRGLLETCRSLRIFPYRGTIRSDLKPRMRVISYKRTASIVFRIEEDKRKVIILGVAYAGKSFEMILARNE